MEIMTVFRAVCLVVLVSSVSARVWNIKFPSEVIAAIKVCQSCKADEKCVKVDPACSKIGCEMKCQEKETPRPPCNTFPSSPLAKSCSTNEDCEDDESCCSGKCQGSRVIVKPSPCGRPTSLSKPDSKRCTTNDDCEDDEPCCFGFCQGSSGSTSDPCENCEAPQFACVSGFSGIRRECISTAPKPGQCPIEIVFVFMNRCTYDYQCSGDQKCCKTDCRTPTPGIRLT